MTEKKLFIFDFDGTLIDSKRIVYKLNKVLFKEVFSIDVDRAEFYQLYDDNFYSSFFRLLEKKKGIVFKMYYLAKLMLSKKSFYTYLDKLALELKKNKKYFVPFKGTRTMLNRLKKNKNAILALVSSDVEEFVNERLKTNKISVFHDVLCARFSLSKVRKIEYLTRKYGIAKDNTYYIGDTIGDIKEAKKEAVKTIAVTFGFHSKEHLKQSRIKADHYAYSMAELSELLRRIVLS